MSILDDLTGFGEKIIFGVSPAAVDEVVGIAQTALPLLRSASDEFQRIVNIPAKIGEIAENQHIIIDDTTKVMSDLGRLRDEVRDGFGNITASLMGLGKQITELENVITTRFDYTNFNLRISSGPIPRTPG